mgnify:CR=1 FL=1
MPDGEWRHWRDLRRRLDRYNKLRAALGDFDSHIDDIPKPKGMRVKDFERKLTILRGVEDDIQRLSLRVFKLRDTNDGGMQRQE